MAMMLRYSSIFRQSFRWIGQPIRCKSSANTGIQYEQRDQVYWIRLDRTKQYNAISLELYAQLTKILQQVAKNDHIKLAIVTGNGPYFSSGNDLSKYCFLSLQSIPNK